MPTFEIHAVPLPNGSFSPAWFDDDRYLWDEPLLIRTNSLVSGWRTPSLILHRPDRGITPVLYNPNAFAVSKKLKEALSHFKELEFLPIQIKDEDVFYVLHVVASLDLPFGSIAQIPGSPGNNIVDIQAFPASFNPLPSFFRIRQPSFSAAGRVGSCVRKIYVNAKAAQTINELAGDYINASEVPST